MKKAYDGTIVLTTEDLFSEAGRCIRDAMLEADETWNDVMNAVFDADRATDRLEDQARILRDRMIRVIDRIVVNGVYAHPNPLGEVQGAGSAVDVCCAQQEFARLALRKAMVRFEQAHPGLLEVAWPMVEEAVK